MGSKKKKLPHIFQFCSASLMFDFCSLTFPSGRGIACYALCLLLEYRSDYDTVSKPGI